MTSMPQGSVIRTHHEIGLVTPDVRAPAVSWWRMPSVASLPSALLQPACQSEREMAQFDYAAAAELFPSRQRSRMTGAVAYMRFAAASEAIRYAIEVLPAKSMLGTYLEVNEERFDSNAIRRLYESAEYPLRRQPAGIRDRLLAARQAS
jgi:hypothetical protein